jgi:hypothetical protein
MTRWTSTWRAASRPCFVTTRRRTRSERASPSSASDRVGFRSAPNEIVIRYDYATLYRKDGGFPASSDAPGCADAFQAHDGDIQVINVNVRVTGNPRLGLPWRAELLFGEGDGCTTTTRVGTHPVLYPSAGKHHTYCHAGTFVYETDGGLGDCFDPHRGNGAVRLPVALFHMPFSPILHTDGNQMPNACIPGRFGRERPGNAAPAQHARQPRVCWPAALA